MFQRLSSLSYHTRGLAGGWPDSKVGSCQPHPALAGGMGVEGLEGQRPSARAQPM